MRQQWAPASGRCRGRQPPAPWTPAWCQRGASVRPRQPPHHLDKLVVVHLAVAVGVCLPNHLIHLLFSQLLAQVGHHVPQLQQDGAGWGEAGRAAGEAGEVRAVLLPKHTASQPASQRVKSDGAAARGTRSMCPCWRQRCSHLCRANEAVAVLFKHLERLHQLRLAVGVLRQRQRQRTARQAQAAVTYAGGQTRDGGCLRRPCTQSIWEP